MSKILTRRYVDFAMSTLLLPKADDLFFVCKFSEKMLSPNFIRLRIQRLEGKRCRSSEVAHYEPPHQDLRCLQIQLFSSLYLKS